MNNLHHYTQEIEELGLRINRSIANIPRGSGGLYDNIKIYLFLELSVELSKCKTKEEKILIMLNVILLKYKKFSVKCLLKTIVQALDGIRKLTKLKRKSQTGKNNYKRFVTKTYSSNIINNNTLYLGYSSSKL